MRDLIIYLIGINVVTFFIYGIDKWKARRGKWRIPEDTLIWLAIAGGSIGALREDQNPGNPVFAACWSTPSGPKTHDFGPGRVLVHKKRSGECRTFFVEHRTSRKSASYALLLRVLKKNGTNSQEWYFGTSKRLNIRVKDSLTAYTSLNSIISSIEKCVFSTKPFHD